MLPVFPETVSKITRRWKPRNDCGYPTDRLGAHSKIASCPTSEWGFPDQGLLADAELADDGLITLGIVFLEVVEQAAALADQHEKPAA